MNESRPRALDETLDRIGFTTRQKAIVALCALIAMAEGFDTLAIGYLIPSMAKEWAISPGQFGVAVTAGSIGMIVGLVALGQVADRLGRRIVIIVCTLTFALFTGLIVFVQSVEALSVLRFLAGLGLGAALANVIALAVELVPTRSKAKVATLVGSGAVAGGVVCGLVAQAMVPAFGWTSVFVVGAVIPLLLAVVAMWMLPESVEYLLAKGRQAEARRFLLLIDPGDSGAPLAAVGEARKGAPKAPVAALFTDVRNRNPECAQPGRGGHVPVARPLHRRELDAGDGAGRVADLPRPRWAPAEPGHLRGHHVPTGHRADAGRRDRHHPARHPAVGDATEGRVAAPERIVGQQHRCSRRPDTWGLTALSSSTSQPHSLAM